MLALHPFPVSAHEPPAWDGYIVKLHDDVSWVQTMSLDTTYEQRGHFLVVDTLEQAAELPEHYVEYIEPNYYVELFTEQSPESTASDPYQPGSGSEIETAIPNDPYYADYQWNLQEINALTAYQQGLTGKGVRIGFIDSGINAHHEDLDPNLISGKNFNSDGLAYDQDNYSHGTFAAGIVAAQTNNGLGLAGIAPEAEIVAYRVFSLRTSTISAVVSAIDEAIEDGCDIINLSLGTPSHSLLLKKAIDRAAEAGIIMVAAVGNSGSSTLQYPAAYSAVIGVGSVDTGLTVSSFSQRNSSVYVTAPGGGVVSLDNTDPEGYRLDMTNAANCGTSFAAPVITGMAALALGYDSDITEQGIRYLLETTSTDRGDSGYDNSYGYGVVDVEAFLTELQREFTIQYALDGGVLPAQTVQSYQVTDAALALPIPVKTGYQFVGWYTSNDLSGVPVTQIDAGSLGDKTFFAAWSALPAEEAPFPCGSELAVENCHLEGLVRSITSSPLVDETIDIHATLNQDLENAVLYLSFYHASGQLKAVHWVPFSQQTATLSAIPYNHFFDPYMLSVLGPNMEPLILPICGP